jgi:hypothetical protein
MSLTSLFWRLLSLAALVGRRPRKVGAPPPDTDL